MKLTESRQFASESGKMRMSSKGELKRSSIIEVATNMLKDKNYSEIRVEDIASKAEMAKSMVFYYFESKGALYLEIYAMLRKNLDEEYAEEIAKAADDLDEDGVEDLVLKLTDILLNRHTALVRLMIDIDGVYQECSRSNIQKKKLEIETYEYNVASLLAKKTKIFTLREFAYILSVVNFCVSGYYRREMGNFKSAQKEKGYHYYEAKSICEYRIARMIRYFLTGMFADHNK